MMDFDTPVVRRGTDCAKWDTFDKIYGGTDLIHVGCADMDFKSPPEVCQAFADAAAHGVFGYTDLSDDFYTGVASWYQRRHQVKIGTDEIMFTPRINIACGLCIEALTRPGDEVILNAPAYPPLAQAAQDNGRFIIETPFREEGDSFVLDLESLEAKVSAKTKFMILVNPHNPTTRCWTVTELQQIADFCVRHDLYLFCDEIHADFIKAGCSFHSILEISDPAFQSRLIVANSPAKTFNVMGALAAYLIIRNPKLRQAFYREMQRIGEHNPSLFANAVLKTVYQHCEYYVAEVNAYIDQNELFIRKEFARLFPGLEIKRREGTYLLWMDFRKVFASEEQMFDFFLNQARVEVYPGSHFGRSFSGFMRFNLAESRSTLQEIIERIEKAQKT